MDTLNYIVKKYEIVGCFADNARNPYPISGVTRNDLAALFGELGFKVGAEIGVESGVYSQTLLEANPALSLISVDPWKPYRAYRDHVSTPKLEAFYAAARQRLAAYGDRSIILRKTSQEALGDIADETLDFVYIDANHAFPYITHDIHYWLKKVRKGGIISGHDYKKHKAGVFIHVKQVVGAYVDSYHIRPVFILGADAKVDGVPRDDSRSWFWVKL